MTAASPVRFCDRILGVWKTAHSYSCLQCPMAIGLTMFFAENWLFLIVSGKKMPIAGKIRLATGLNDVVKSGAAI